MAISINEFNKKIDRLVATLPGKLLDAIEIAGLDAKADINNRIVETGRNYKGEPLPPYTPGYLQFKQDVGRYTGHVDLSLGNYSINKRIDAVQRRKKQRGQKTLSSEQRQSVTSKRRAKNIPEGGTFWLNVNVIEKKNANNILRVTIGPRDDQNKKKLEGLSKKRPGILQPSNQESQKIVDKVGSAFQKEIDNLFG